MGLQVHVVETNSNDYEMTMSTLIATTELVSSEPYLKYWHFNCVTCIPLILYKRIARNIVQMECPFLIIQNSVSVIIFSM